MAFSTRFLLRQHSILYKNMPLKARLLSTSTPIYKVADIEQLSAPLSNDDPDDVTFKKTFGLRSMELNRPAKLNSLNGSMARKLLGRLNQYKNSDLAQILVLKGAGRALCAGGDVATLAEWNQEGPEGQQKSSDYFALEYKLDHLIATYDKPYIAYMDGITMGGGVGLSVHAPFRIATEKTVFAMPETTIGFFPEVGATFFLPRMHGELGTYLALTSEQLRGVDVFYHGIATHFIHSTSLDNLSERLSRLEFQDHTPIQEKYKLINSVLADFDTGLPAESPQLSSTIRNHISSIFSGNSALEIVQKLEKLTSSSKDPEIVEWAQKTAATIRERSPIGVSVTLKALRQGRNWDISQTFRNEHAIASVFMRHPDFVTGVTARLIKRTKGRPKWAPKTLEEVTSNDVDAFFEKVNSDEDPLVLLETGKSASYQQYPHAWLALPDARKIIDTLNHNKGDRDATLKQLLKETENKVGVREKVADVFNLL